MSIMFMFFYLAIIAIVVLVVRKVKYNKPRDGKAYRIRMIVAVCVLIGSFIGSLIGGEMQYNAVREAFPDSEEMSASPTAVTINSEIFEYAEYEKFNDPETSDELLNTLITFTGELREYVAEPSEEGMSYGYTVGTGLDSWLVGIGMDSADVECDEVAAEEWFEENRGSMVEVYAKYTGYDAYSLYSSWNFGGEPCCTIVIDNGKIILTDTAEAITFSDFQQRSASEITTYISDNKETAVFYDYYGENVYPEDSIVYFDGIITGVSSITNSTSVSVTYKNDDEYINALYCDVAQGVLTENVKTGDAVRLYGMVSNDDLLVYLIEGTDLDFTLADVENDFRADCEEYSYQDLMRYPEDYSGERIVQRLYVAQVMDYGYRCYAQDDGYSGWDIDSEIYLTDLRQDKDNSLKILKDDFITVYGTYVGLETVTRALTSANEEIPQINAYYVYNESAGEEPGREASQPSNGTLQLGMENAQVEELQLLLQELGYLDSVTGYFGTDTEAAVKAFQENNGMTADGIAGSATIDKLQSEDAIAATE